MARDREEVRREIEDTKASLSAKLGELSERVGHAREKVGSAREKMSVRHQVQERPWTAVGVAVAAGAVLYRVRRSWRRRHAALTLEDMREVAQTAASYIGGASRTAGETADRGEELAETRPARRIIRRGGVLDAVAKAAMASVTRTVVSALSDRLRHYTAARGAEDHYGSEEARVAGAPAAEPGYPDAVGTAVRGAPR